MLPTYSSTVNVYATDILERLVHAAAHLIAHVSITIALLTCLVLILALATFALEFVYITGIELERYYHRKSARARTDLAKKTQDPTPSAALDPADAAPLLSVDHQ